MPDESLDFLVRTTFDGSGTSQAQKSFADLNASVKDSAAPMGNYGKATEEAARSTERTENAHRELHRAMHLVMEQSPLLGLASRGAMSPVGALLIGAIELFGKEKEAIKALNESLTTGDWENYTAAIEAAKGALEELIEKEHEHERLINRIHGGDNTPTERSDNAGKVDKAKADAAAALAEANKKAEIAATDTIRDPIEQAGKRLEIENRYAAIKKQQDDQEAQRGVNEEHRKLANEQIEEQRLARQLSGAREKQKGVSSEAEVNEKLRIEKERLQKIDEEKDKKQERHDEIERKPWVERSTPQQIEMNELSIQLEALDKQKEAQKNLVKKLEEQHLGKIDKARAAAEQVTDMEGRHRGAAERVRALQDNIPTDDKVAGIKAAERQRQAEIDQRTRTSEFNKSVIDSPQGKMFREAADAESAKEHGQKLSQTQNSTLQGVSKMLQGQGQNAQAILHALSQAHANDTALAREILTIHKKLEGVTSQLRGVHNP